MSQFFSCNSNGKGKVIFFTIEDIVKEMAQGNPKNYDWNSHTSIADYFGIKSAEEDKWNKWEYNPYKKELTIDRLNTTDDNKKVKQVLEEYFKNKNLDYLRNLYNGNSGDRNSGDNNSGCIIGHFSSQKLYFLFNKPCTEKEASEVNLLELWRYFNLTEWITEDKMTEKEKETHPFYKTTQGYLKTKTYKEAWALVPKEVIEKIKELANFDKEVFFSITGIQI